MSIKPNTIRQILFAASLVILSLSILVINASRMTDKYNRLLIDAQSVIESWNGLERIKNDFLMNRSNINVLGYFEYKKNVTDWENQINDFEKLFNKFIKGTSEIQSSEVVDSDLRYASMIWRATYSKLIRIHETLGRIEKEGLDSFLFPELINNYYIYRMTDRIDFDDNILLMNLLNQFAFLDISSKEFYRLINNYTNTLQQEHETISNRLIFLSWILLILLVFLIILIYYSYLKILSSDRHIEEFLRNEKNTGFKRFLKGLEPWDNVKHHISETEKQKFLGGRAVTVLLRFGRYSEMVEKYGPTEINRRLSAISFRLETVLNSRFLFCSVIPFEEGITILHHLRGQLLSETAGERISSLIYAVRELIPDDSIFRFTYTHGDMHKFPEETQGNFKKVYEASYYKILYGDEKIISVREIETRICNTEKYPMQLEKQLTDYIKQGSTEKAKKVYTELITVLTSSEYKIIRNGINRVVVAITSALDTLEKFNDLGNEFDIIDFTKRIYSMETVAEINRAIFELIDHIATELEEKKDNYKYNQISMINEIIEKDFSNPNLSTGLISERLNLSSAYLSRIFKLRTGISIQETINKKRIETACQLMLNKDTTVSEICKSVGIANSMYFYTLFKKYFGTTPKEYRQKIKNNHSMDHRTSV